MRCAYCGKPATAIDLCHGRTPVCIEHRGIGHQLEPLQSETKSRR